jgi:hypothetical protein
MMEGMAWDERVIGLAKAQLDLALYHHRYDECMTME